MAEAGLIQKDIVIQFSIMQAKRVVTDHLRMTLGSQFINKAPCFFFKNGTKVQLHNFAVECQIHFINTLKN